MIGAAEGVAEEGISFTREQADKFLQDPISYFITTSRRIGVGMLATGTGLGVAAYYMKASATAAMNNELSVISNLGTIFSNIRAPSFTPGSTATAPLSASLTGVQNFFSDAWQDVQAAGSDVAQTGAVLGTLGEDVAVGIVDLAKSFLGFVMHFPDILWNGLVWGVGGAVADVLTWVFPWLLLFGGILIVASMVAWGARAIWEITVGAPAKEAWREKKAQVIRTQTDRFRSLLHVRGRSAAPESFIRASQQAEHRAQQVNQASEAPEVDPGQTNPPASISGVPGTAAPSDKSGGTSDKQGEELRESPIAAGTPTVEVEAQLGEPPAIEPTNEELREMEKNRLASMPA